MKKKLMVVLLVLVMMLGLGGCAKEKKVHIDTSSIKGLEMVSIPEGTKSGSFGDDGITVTLSKNGTYEFVAKDEEGKTYTIVLKYENGTVEAFSDDLDNLVVGIVK